MKKLLSKKVFLSIKKQRILLSAASVIAVAVVAILLLRTPPLFRESGVETMVIFIGGRGHKEITDFAQQQQVLEIINQTRRKSAPEDTRNGARAAVYLFYEDGTQDVLWLRHHTEDYIDDHTGTTYAAGDFMLPSSGGYFAVKDGTVSALRDICDAIDTPYNNGTLPEKLLQKAELSE